MHSNDVRRPRLSALLAVTLAMLMLALSVAPARADTPPRPTSTVGGITTEPPPARQDEFGVRTEKRLGDVDCRPADLGKGYCELNEWLATRSQNFVNISKRSFMSSTLEYPQGIRVNASFVAENDETTVAAYFSAEAYLENDVVGSGRRMFARALLDGVAMAPGDAVFATTGHQGMRQMIFTAKVPKGIHTVEIQWKVDGETTGYLRDANILVRTGRPIASAKGSLVALTPKSGVSLEKSDAAWADIPGTSGVFYSPADGVATISFAAESKVNGGSLGLRAVIDGAVALPNDVVFARNNGAWQSRGFTFGKEHLSVGWHSFKMQWYVDKESTGYLGDRSTVVAAYPNSTLAPSHPFVSPPSGPNVIQPVTGMALVPGLSTSVTIPAKGNGEVAVIFSAEIVSPTTAYAALRVDGVFKEGNPLLTDGTAEGPARSYVLEAKHLSPGAHTLEIWVGGIKGKTEIGDRSMAVMSETGYVPDLAEAPALTGGRITSDNVGGIEPLIGPHKVLAILFDPRDCADAPAPTADQKPCVDSGDLTPAKVEQALFGPAGDNVNGYFKNMSGDRFSIVNAGVLGWYDAPQKESYYWDKNWKSCDYNDSGFSSGHAARIADAITAASADIDFSKFDINGDGRLTSHELAIIVVVPQANGDGSSLALAVSAQCPGNTPLTFNGVALQTYVSGWFTSLDPALETYQFSTAAHELLHQFSLLDDLYIAADHAAYSRELSLMSSNRWTSTHLDPIQKLAFGWVTPRLVDADQALSLTYVELSGKVVVLPRYNSAAGEEYYVIENRKSNAGPNRYDDGIFDSGIGVWHAVVDPVQASQHPIGVTQAFWDTTAAATDNPGDGTMGRWGIRLLRPFQAINFNGVAIFANKNNTLWDSSEFDLDSGACPAVFGGPGVATPNRLAWADCTASGYNIDFTSAVADTMAFDIDVN